MKRRGASAFMGTVDHSDLYAQDENNRWWNEYNIRRSIFMGDYVYAISSAGITATNLTTLEETARVLISEDTQPADTTVSETSTDGEGSSSEDKPLSDEDSASSS